MKNNEIIQSGGQNLPVQHNISMVELLKQNFQPVFELTAAYFDPKLVEVGEVINIICTKETVFVDSENKEKKAIQFVALINGVEQSFISAATILVGSLCNQPAYPFKAQIVYLGKVKAKYTYDNFKVYLCH